MLIILEGSDCSGKTTFAGQLERRLERVGTVMRLSCGTPAGHPLDEYVVPLLGYRPYDEQSTHVICDRLHWGELVYPAVLGRSSAFDDAQFAYVEAFLQSRGAVVVYLSAPTSELERRMRERGDDVIVPEQLAEISCRYEDAWWQSQLPSIAIPDVSTIDETVIDVIIQEAELNAHAASKLRNFTTYVGPPNPTRLLLGDVRGPAFQTDDPIDRIRPAFMPYPSTSGAYLWRALTHEPLSRSARIGVANACDVDDPYELWQTLDRPYTVTLGKNAEAKFRSYADTIAPHPQWVRRFKHSMIGDYHEQLVGIREVAWN